VITLRDFLTASGKYPDRESSEELTEELLGNASILLDKVNKFLQDIEIQGGTLKVSSGFRPAAVNAAIPNAAKKSNHMICKAIDLEDHDGSLDALVAKHPDLLRKYELFQEDPESTKGWCHLDFGTRGDRPSRQFKV
jgi:hypothetical protein